MKKLYFSILAIAVFTTCFSQNDYKKRPAFGFGFVHYDFQTAKDIRATSLGSVIRAKNLFRFSRMEPGLSLNYLGGVGNYADFIATLSATQVDYPSRNLSNADLGSNRLLSDLTAGLNLKLLSDNYWVTPFISIALGASSYNGYFAAIAPIGAGLQVNFFDEAFLIFNSQYRLPVTQNATYHFYHSLSISGNIGNNKTEIPKAVELPVVVIKDRDGDGVVDSLDACPDIAGPASLNGCPDRDGDGIADIKDSCPDVAGIPKYQGCPVPDTDKDGVNDENDKCPNVPGVARYDGCPIPDTDKDGVNDEEDKCPNEPGSASNFGCPEIKQEIIEKVNLAARNVFFASGSAKLLAKSNTSLNNVVQILTDNPTYKVDIDGHTDSTGSAEKNHVLSHDRANSVKAYLISKGIDESRMTTQGFGPDKPIAPNKTVAGRSKNRRVEMKLKNY
ncbi:MAG: OmpA family protein [Ginsengibacter sp.]